MKRLSKQEAIAFFGITMTTLDRRIKRGEINTESEANGNLRRVWVLVDEDTVPTASAEVQLAVSQETIKRLEELIESKDEALVRERETSAEAEKRLGEIVEAKDQALNRERESAIEKDKTMQLILQRLEEAQRQSTSLTAMLPPVAEGDSPSPMGSHNPQGPWWRRLFGKPR